MLNAFLPNRWVFWIILVRYHVRIVARYFTVLTEGVIDLLSFYRQIP